MAQPLAAFQGTVLYVDAMILVAFLDTASPWHAASRHLFYRAVELMSPIRLVTARDHSVQALIEAARTRTRPARRRARTAATSHWTSRHRRRRRTPAKRRGR